MYGISRRRMSIGCKSLSQIYVRIYLVPSNYSIALHLARPACHALHIGEMLVDPGVWMEYNRHVHVHAASKYLNWPSRNLITKDNYHVEISTQAASAGYLALLTNSGGACVWPNRPAATLIACLYKGASGPLGEANRTFHPQSN